MKVRFLKARHWLMAALLAMIGATVSSCEKYGSPESEFETMYGCPTNEYNDSILNH